MKVQKPDIPQNLPENSDAKLLFCVDDDGCDVENRHLVNVESEGSEGKGKNYYRVVFENCRILKSDMSKNTFIDVVFNNCDFSNTNFCGAFFKAVEFRGCKCLGTDFSGGSLQHILIDNCNFSYADFNETLFNTVNLRDSDCSCADFSHCRLKNLTLESSIFDHVSFFKTSLRGIDFSKSRLGRMNISDDFKELGGVIVNTVQAAEIAKLLNVVVRD